MNTNKDDIESKARKAIALVQGIDHDFRTAAFSVIFERMLNRNENTSYTTQQEKVRQTTNVSSKETDIQQKKGEFAKNCGITVNELDEVLYFETDIIKVIAPVSGNESAKQLIFAKCILTAFDVVLGQPWVKALTLSKCIGASKVGQLNNLARNLQKDKQSIRPQGSKKYTKYKITEYGKALTFDIMKKLAKGETL